MTDPKTDEYAGDDGSYAAAARFVGLVVLAALAVLGLIIWWLSGCRTDSPADPLAGCGGLQRNLLAIGPTLILFVGGVWAFVKTYRLWRDDARNWWVWQGAGWFLLVAMLFMLTMTASLALR